MEDLSVKSQPAPLQRNLSIPLCNYKEEEQGEEKEKYDEFKEIYIAVVVNHPPIFFC